ncbi:MAG: hypothetical protein K0Q66_1318 [Chitinophagaceae bacterium]|jgi:hypothetical protein|nr:hypothetical protein [Chitinophagaceae bacterium]
MEMKSQAIIRNMYPASTQPTLQALRRVPLSKVKPIFQGCDLDELHYYLKRATEQEEYELCAHISQLIKETGPVAA